MKNGDYLLIAVILLIILILKRGQIFAVFAKFCYAKGDVQKALRIFDLADKIGGMNTKNVVNYGYLYLRQGNTQKAEEILKKAYIKEKNPVLRKKINSIFALVLWKENDLDGAIDMLEGVLDGFQETTVYQNLGVFYILKGDGEKALEFNKKAYKFNSDDLSIMDNLAQSLVLCGKSDEAERLYEKILDSEPGFPEPYYGFGELLCERGEKEKGIELIEKALEKNYSFLSVKSEDEVKEILSRYKKEVE